VRRVRLGRRASLPSLRSVSTAPAAESRRPYWLKIREVLLAMKSTRLFFTISTAVALVAACSGVSSNPLGEDGGSGSGSGAGSGSGSGAESSSGTASSGAGSGSVTGSSSSSSGSGSGAGSGSSNGSGSGASSGTGSSSGAADSGPMRPPVPCGPTTCADTCCFAPAPREAGPAYSCITSTCPAGSMQVCVATRDCASGETCRFPVGARDGGTEGGADGGTITGRCVMPMDAGGRG
jgi:hypothetical protein